MGLSLVARYRYSEQASEKGMEGQILFLVFEDKSTDVIVAWLLLFLHVNACVVSDTALLAWPKKKGEGHGGE